MNRAGFLRATLLTPLAALGCRSTGEETPRVTAKGDGPYQIIVPTTWTCDTTTTTQSATVNCSDGGTRWITYETNGTGDTIYALARNYVP